MTTIETPPPGPSERTGGIAGLAPVQAFDSWRAGALADPRHDQRTAAILGISLGTCFTICLVTGLFSHLQQHPVDWITIPSQPAGLFRFTQGLHVATGIAAVPLLLAKLWSVFPRFFRRPPVTGIAHTLERLSLIPLVAGALYQLFSGIINIDLWYPLPFHVITAHYWVAWITIGAMIVHIGAKITITREALRRPSRAEPVALAAAAAGMSTAAPTAATATADATTSMADTDATVIAAPVDVAPDPTRRRFLTFVGASAVGLTAVTIGQTVAPLKELDLLGPRRPDLGESGFPVNASAAETGITPAATDPAWRLAVVGNVATPLSLSLADLQGFAQREAVLPIACVEGWSASRNWRGVSLPDLLARAGAAPDATVTVRSLQKDSSYATSDLNHLHAHDPDTLLALEADGQVLSLDHGYPVRLIAPNRPGVLQTKWLSVVEVH